MKQVGFYVDGFNFYHAVAESKQPHLKWMSYASLAKLLVQRGEEVAYIKIFSAYATHLPHSMIRHRVISKAWAAEGCECIMGRFKRKKVYCKTCRKATEHYEEKESDINIAIHLLEDCRSGLCDVAYVVTTDSDLTPAIAMCRKLYPHVELITVAPPGRNPCKSIIDAGARPATASWHQVISSLMPQQVLDAAGKVVATRPTDYDPPV